MPWPAALPGCSAVVHRLPQLSPSSSVLRHPLLPISARCPADIATRQGALWLSPSDPRPCGGCVDMRPRPLPLRAALKHVALVFVLQRPRPPGDACPLKRHFSTLHSLCLVVRAVLASHLLPDRLARPAIVELVLATAHHHYVFASSRVRGRAGLNLRCQFRHASTKRARNLKMQTI